MTTLPILVRVFILVLSSREWKFLERSWVSLSFVLWIVTKLLCSCLCLFDIIIELHGMDEKNVQWLSHWKWKWILLGIMVYIVHYFYFVYVLEHVTKLNWKVEYKYTSLFYSLPLIHTFVFLCKLLVYKGGWAANVIRYLTKSPPPRESSH